jgi:hypothetical protein
MQLGEIFELYHFPPEDKKGKKSEEDRVGNYARQDIQCEFESELKEELCLFKCEKLRKKESTETLKDSEILFLLDIVPKDSPQDVLTAKRKAFEDKMKIFTDLKKEKVVFICRVYLLNISNVTVEDTLNKESAFFWIKRYESDSNFKQDKKFFDIEDGEINDFVSIPVKWPVKYIFDIYQFLIFFEFL